ncbi:MAG: site-specific integrase [Bacteroidales bacterium]|nr:site-specific integrase [Bacteroidales bacterium]MCM1148402.1 site-specific integrase [Bacteroidales bacterium]MCM1205064.1 site-specific integrase [Bacillota bacterium]MCM1511395.1 site-specific integrase [Clostridium sp.]
MATVKVKFRQSSVNDREGTIYYQVTHNRVARQVKTGYKVYLWEWDAKLRSINVRHDAERKDMLMSIRDKIRWDMNRFNRIVVSFMHRGIPFSAEDIVDEFFVLTSHLSLFGFMESIIARLRHDGRQRTSETYRAALNSFSRFRNGEDLMLDALDRELMESYEAYLLSKGLVPNSVSFHLRILRAVYNRAREQALVPPDVNPFAHVYTGVEKTAKRAVDITTIRRIKNLELGMDRSAGYARDMFMLSFYLRGMSFVDLAYLRKSDLRNGVVTYRRRKTGQKLSIKWTEEMQDVLDKYPRNETEFLFPIITSLTANHRNQYRNRHYRVNRSLKTVAAKIGLQMPLTTYVARHSWASIAKLKDIPISTISEGLGHDSEQTTQIYLASLDTSAVDRANDIILSALQGMQ